MTFTLVPDEFGLLHTAVPHPCQPDRNIQVMVLQAEDGWWAYVDGERVPGTFTSAQQAGRAAASQIDALRSLANSALEGQQLRETMARETVAEDRMRRARWSAPHSTPRRRRPAGLVFAASLVIAVLTTGILALQQTDVLNNPSYAKQATSVETDAALRHTAQDAAKHASMQSLAEFGSNTATVDVVEPLIGDAASTNEGTVFKEPADTLVVVPGRNTSIAKLAPAPVVPVASDTSERSTTAPIPTSADRSSTASLTLPSGADRTLKRDVPAPSLTIRDPKTERGRGPVDKDLLEGRSTASLQSTPDAESEPTDPVAQPRITRSRPNTVKRPRRAKRTKRARKSRSKLRRAKRARKRRVAVARDRRARPRRTTRLRSRQSRRATRRAIRRVKARRVQRVYRSAFGRSIAR